MRPFFVADRPMSLRIIESFFSQYPGARFGLMSHAFVSRQFRAEYARVGTDAGSRGVSDGQGCRWSRSEKPIKCVDCGVFSRVRQPAYEELFEIYDEMHADFGVMKDVIGDRRATIESAAEAVRIFEARPRRFRLVLVSQGSCSGEHLECLETYQRWGYEHVAIGGLLRKRGGTDRYRYAAKAAELEELLRHVRESVDPSWLFVLGCYHPKRHALFERYGVVGSDYKGWIFNYEHRLAALQRLSVAVADSCGCQGEIGSLVRSRVALGQSVEAARRLYGVTKNNGADGRAAKQRARRELNDLRSELEALDARIWKHARKSGCVEGATCGSEEKLEEFVRLLALTDREYRFEGVHDYLRRMVLVNLEGTESRGGPPKQAA